jgi:hypothetical protein
MLYVSNILHKNRQCIYDRLHRVEFNNQSWEQQEQQEQKQQEEQQEKEQEE